ncbi:restriction endonuclease subunit S [Mesorhizobium sp. CA18]|uniref:restriction endonuclease subunit S n=1 Tax=unclassified Mesorhizobium TaxID=325217 RepID=UPI001CCA4F51|nr:MULTISPECIES: restriction endonuclease subunit S [unclassified Mesorhizobium]MBZ9734359.1 restriction endonuclease subunit S [Mesorhizobium sp. CA9]MBZ9824640.1 restriction endonuclease subunit S [Mesorhizobium sp. CA18]MBZ9829402.1 restriction endonuclease subunit S [Mesorhizobium sp. CA2]MBZ9878008.1 restriction endonuclease subunit S [Mesorhizobium sp. Ca11]MBZ9902886.1 restriction endonuclease subunit S [Mesorhizobium sp. CA17]
MVPEGWTRHSLEDVAEIRTGLAKGKQYGDPIYMPYLRVANVQDGYLDLSEIKQIAVGAEAVDRYLLRYGDVVLTEGGDFDKLGRGTLWRGEIPTCLHQNHVFAVRTKTDVLSPEFFAAQSGSPYGRRYFLSCAKRSTNLASINSTQLKQFPVLLPPLPEQKKIAEILSTWDAAIATTEKLLANAEAQKRALMQQLLTGRRRLKGFGSDWVRVQIGSLLKETRRAVDWSDDNLYSLLSLRRRSGGLFLRERLHGREILTKGMKTTKAGDFLISKMQVVHGAMAMTPAKYDGMHISNSYISLIPRNKGQFEMRFFDWLSRMPFMYRLAYLSSYGVHIEKMTFNLDWFLQEKIVVPATAAEQSRIADILDAAQYEVDTLSAVKAKILDEKRALLQQLLTGKRRVTA